MGDDRRRDASALPPAARAGRDRASRPTRDERTSHATVCSTARRFKRRSGASERRCPLTSKGGSPYGYPPPSVAADGARPPAGAARATRPVTDRARAPHRTSSRQNRQDQARPERSSPQCPARARRRTRLPAGAAVRWRGGPHAEDLPVADPPRARIGTSTRVSVPPLAASRRVDRRGARVRARCPSRGTSRPVGEDHGVPPAVGQLGDRERGSLDGHGQPVEHDLAGRVVGDVAVVPGGQVVGLST